MIYLKINDKLFTKTCALPSHPMSNIMNINYIPIPECSLFTQNIEFIKKIWIIKS